MDLSVGLASTLSTKLPLLPTPNPTPHRPMVKLQVLVLMSLFSESALQNKTRNPFSFFDYKHVFSFTYRNHFVMYAGPL